ncbi:MAG: hypothetical protein II320_03890, partial [Oscillospiraceae bacterium]|nr:hypothetical protein [Oscillospiraceae bacterium]
MTRLWIMLGACLMIAVLIDYRDKSLAARGYTYRDRVLTCVLIIMLGFFCGLRIWGNDTTEY